MRSLLETAAERAIAYLEGLEERPVAPSATAVAGLAALDEPLPEQPTNPSSNTPENTTETTGHKAVWDGDRGGDRPEGGFRGKPSFDKRPGGPAKRFGKSADRRG